MKPKKLLVLAAMPFLAACDINIIPDIFKEDAEFSWANYSNETSAMNIQSKKFENYQFTESESIVNNLKSQTENSLNKGNLDNFSKYYNELCEAYYKVIDDYIVSSTKYYADSSNTEIRDLSNEYYNQYNTLRKYFISLETDIYDSSNRDIISWYFGDMTDAEIEARLAKNEGLQIQTEYEARFKELTDAADVMYNNFYNGYYTLDQYLDKGYQAYIDYIDVTNEFIGKVDYDNYLDFSYESDFERDYHYGDAANFVNYVKEYLVPIYKKSTELTVPIGDLNLKIYNALDQSNFCNSKTDSAAMFDKYANDLGGEYLKCYNHAWSNGYWCFSNSSKSLGTAFEWSLYSVDDAVLYFSKNYQKILTILHEFGHYYSEMANNGLRRNDPMDLAETYSQGDEFTFLNFLCNEKKDTSDYATYKYYADKYAYGNLYYLIQEACITEIEIYAYTTPNLTKTTLRSGVESILASYDGTASEYYFMGPCLCSPNYYISYATSMVEALQFLSYPYEEAKTMYTNLIENQSGNTMVDRWKSAGLPSPFEETSVQNLGTMLSDICKKYNGK